MSALFYIGPVGYFKCGQSLVCTEKLTQGNGSVNKPSAAETRQGDCVVSDRQRVALIGVGDIRLFIELYNDTCAVRALCLRRTQLVCDKFLCPLGKLAARSVFKQVTAFAVFV